MLFVRILTLPSDSGMPFPLAATKLSPNSTFFWCAMAAVQVALAKLAKLAKRERERERECKGIEHHRTEEVSHVGYL